MRNFYEIINKEKVDELDSKEVVNVLIKFIELVRKTKAKDRMISICIQKLVFNQKEILNLDEARLIESLIDFHPTMYHREIGIYYFPKGDWRLRLSYLRKLIKIYSN